MRLVIVDDEPLARARLRRLLGAHADVEILAELDDAAIALAELPRLAPDVALLDVRMPHHDGFELASALDPRCHVIFVTAFTDHAVRAFDADATDYLVKPVDGVRLGRALDRVRERMREGTGPVRLAVRDGSRFVFVAVAEIDAAIARGNYVELRAGGTVYTLRSTLADVEGRLGELVRIHRSVLVRAERITAIEPLFRGEYLVTLADGTSFTSARSHRAELRRALGLT
jgi:two-component system LytT family response regulator